MSPVAVLAALAIGGSLGLIGGGGSILTVPALVHAAGLEPRAAIAASLVIVGLTAFAGAIFHRRRGNVDLPTVAWFGGLGALGAAGGARVSAMVDARLLLIGFATLAVTAGITMLRRRHSATERPLTDPRKTSRAAVIASALGVGFLTGFFGVGGGFLIVPALALVVGLPMVRAIGTSLAVIALNCAAGIAVAHSALERAHTGIIAAFVLLAIAGSLFGARQASRSRPETLARAFAVLVMAVGVYTGARAW